MSDPTIARIDALTANARSTWLGLFSVLIFAVVTLVSVEHIDFYGVDRGTQLPLVNITVPTYLFFYAAPILIFAMYGYLHLYLIRLWDALAEAPGRIDGTRLNEAVSPWLMTDAALSLRQHFRRDGCAKRRETDYTSMALNFVISWLAGPFVLGWVWCQSMPARDFRMTAVGAIMFTFSLAMGTVSLRLLFRRMRQVRPLPQRFGLVSTLYLVAVTLSAAVVLIISWGRTVEPLTSPPLYRIPAGPGLVHIVDFDIPLATIDLQDQRITERPSGWLPYAIAYEEDRAAWCKRKAIKDCAELPRDQRQQHLAEWRIKRTAQINDLKKPTHLNRYKEDDFPEDPVGYPLTEETRKIETDFPDGKGNRITELEIKVRVPDPAILHKRFDLTNADLRGAFLAGTNLAAARMTGASASEADFEGATLAFADLGRASLGSANLSKANLSRAQLQDANLSDAQLQDANLSDAQLQDANLFLAQLQRAVLSMSILTDSSQERQSLLITDLSASTNDGGALRSVDLSRAHFDDHADWRNVFLDASVTLTPYQRFRMGDPCQWADDTILPDEEFFGRWREWFERRAKDVLRSWEWREIAPEAWRDVPATNTLPEGCTWHTGPLELTPGAR